MTEKITLTMKREEDRQITITVPLDCDIDEIKQEVLLPLLLWYGFQQKTIEQILPDIN